MLDFSHLASRTKADVQVFNANSFNQDTGCGVWNKPRGVSMVYMLALGAGSGGGNGAVGAASTAAGGGGGGSGGQTTLLIPSIFLPDTLYCQVGYSGGTAHTKVSIRQNFSTVNDIVCYAQYSSTAGGNAAGATAGGGGTGGNVVTIGTMPLAGMGRYNFLAGQAGIAGGTTFGGDLTRPTTGLVVTGGTGGGGLNAAGGGTYGGGNILAAGIFPAINGGGSGVNAGINSAGRDGGAGYQPIAGLLHFSGGAGGSSQSTNAIPAAAGGGFGGNGAPGCGGGGGGGGFTGSTTATGGKGGPGLVIIIAW